jgi:hypothetical protein
MQTQLKFQCPHCDQRLQSMQEHAGLSFDCPQCTASIVVPTTHALVPVNQPVVIAEAIDDYEEYGMARHGHYQDDSKPVEMRLGNLAGMKVDVDKPTRNAMATTFLGGILVALGAILFAMFGGKGRSA